MQQFQLLFQDEVVRLGSDSPNDGFIQKVTYFDEETGQCVLEIKSSHFQQNFLISGRLPAAHPGQRISFQTDLSPEQILQHKGPVAASQMIASLPSGQRNLRRFLRSEAFPEIDPRLAQLLAESFPENLFTVLQSNPGKLLQVTGIGSKRKEQVLQAWRDYKARTEISEFLFENHLPLVWGRILWPLHREKTLQCLSSHPYQTVGTHQFDFDKIDRFALCEGYSLDSAERIRCALMDVLNTAYRQGHCAFPETRVLELLGDKLQVDHSRIEEILEAEILSEHLIQESIRGTPCLYLHEIWELEKAVAAKLLQFQLREPPWGWLHLEKVLSWAQGLLHLQLAPLQKKAIETALASSLTVITGGPGTGKTTLIRSLITILQTQSLRYALCSPTGRAAQRLEEAAGVPAQTIHRLLKLNPNSGAFQFHRGERLPLDLVLIDEVSMVDLALMNHLLDALPDHCALILVGDADQIPSVGAGNVLQSIIECGLFSTVRLTEIFRQQAQSLITINAHRINSGEMPILDHKGEGDFRFFPVHSNQEAKSQILRLVTEVIPRECGILDSRQFQILVPMNKGSLGTAQLNEDLQKQLSAQVEITNSEEDSTVSGFGQTFKIGDKVMVNRNDYRKEVFNGDIGFIRQIDHFSQRLSVDFEQRRVDFKFDEMNRLTLASAISIHKSQGSEYRAVIVVLTAEHLPIAQRHLIYTAVTRGKEYVFLVADPTALQAAIRSDDHNRRWQKLTEILKLKSEEQIRDITRSTNPEASQSE